MSIDRKYEKYTSSLANKNEYSIRCVFKTECCHDFREYDQKDL